MKHNFQAQTLLTTLGLGLALLLPSLISAQTRREPASAGRASYIEVEKGVNLHVTDLGDGQPIVLIHGWPLSNEMFEYQYQYLVGKGFRVIGITLRGYGKSDKPYGRYDLDVFSDDIKIVLEKLNVKNALLGGFSMGGAVTLHYVNKYKAAHVSKLALFGAAAPLWKQRADFPYGVTEQDAEGLIELSRTNRPQVLDNFDKGFAKTETSLSKGLSDWLKSINLEASPYAATQSLYALRDMDLRPAMASVQIPVAIFHGVHDKLNSYSLAEQMKKGFRNAELIPFENSGHALFLEELDKFNTELEKFARK